MLVIAENAQTTKKWNRAKALAAVQEVKKGGNSALHALDDLADAGVDAGQAAKLVVLDTEPLGLSARKFNPDGDAKSVNLKAVITAGARPDGSYGAFNATLYAAIVLRVLTGSVPANTVAYIRSAEQANGGWGFSGLPTGTDVDIDSTGLAIQALVAGKVAANNADLRQGLAFLAAQHQANGVWQSFGDDDPNSTSVAVLAISAAGFDPTKACWRDVVAPGSAGDPVRVTDLVDRGPAAGERTHREPQRRVRHQHVRVDTVDRGVAPRLGAGEAAREAGLPVEHEPERAGRLSLALCRLTSPRQGSCAGRRGARALRFGQLGVLVQAEPRVLAGRHRSA